MPSLNERNAVRRLQDFLSDPRYIPQLAKAFFNVERDVHATGTSTDTALGLAAAAALEEEDDDKGGAEGDGGVEVDLESIDSMGRALGVWLAAESLSVTASTGMSDENCSGGSEEANSCNSCVEMWLDAAVAHAVRGATNSAAKEAALADKHMNGEGDADGDKDEDNGEHWDFSEGMVAGCMLKEYVGILFKHYGFMSGCLSPIVRQLERCGSGDVEGEGEGLNELDQSFLWWWLEQPGRPGMRGKAALAMLERLTSELFARLAYGVQSYPPMLKHLFHIIARAEANAVTSSCPSPSPFRRAVFHILLAPILSALLDPATHTMPVDLPAGSKMASPMPVTITRAMRATGSSVSDQHAAAGTPATPKLARGDGGRYVAALGRAETAALRSKQLSLAEVMRSADGYVAMLAYASSTHCDELVRYWKEVDDLECLYGRAVPTERAMGVADRYIREGSDEEINISAAQRTALLAHIDASGGCERTDNSTDVPTNAMGVRTGMCDLRAFSAVQHEVLDLLLASDPCQRLHKEHAEACQAAAKAEVDAAEVKSCLVADPSQNDGGAAGAAVGATATALPSGPLPDLLPGAGAEQRAAWLEGAAWHASVILVEALDIIGVEGGVEIVGEEGTSASAGGATPEEVGSKLHDMADHIKRTVPSDRSHEELGAFYDRMKQPVGQRQSVPSVHPHASQRAAGGVAESGTADDEVLAPFKTNEAQVSYMQVVERTMHRVVYDAPPPREDSGASLPFGTGPWVPGSPTHRNELTFNGLVARAKLDAGRMFEALAAAP